jgi:2-hydroxychromene-2-carboxylate isomerase
MAVVEYFYATHSVYAYLGASKFIELTGNQNHEIMHKPFNLSEAIIGVGSITIGERNAAHLDYFFRREVERWSEFRGVPLKTFLPTHHFNSLLPSSAMLIAGSGLGLNIDRLAHAMMKFHWLYDADLADKETLATIARSVDIDPLPLLALIESEKILKVFKANTMEAIKRSVFGSPTYIVDGDMFYGQDRLELLERALIKPFQYDAKK